ncbi:MAG: glutamine amidotransferase [Acidimicrobiales bacterium]|nr:glutamine amidotransferase [Acidimicrobiales bacterium]
MADPARPSAVRIALLVPELLGTYGDNGNALVLERRLTWRGIPAEVLRVEGGAPLPSEADLYLLGGGEDRPQILACEELAASAVLPRVVDRGAAVFGVCAGFQLLGRSFPGADGAPRPGLGLLDARTRRGDGPRAVGEVVVSPQVASGLPLLTGFENHGGVTELGPGVTPLGTVLAGVGNGAGRGDEGAVAGRVIGTYLHGPVLARNPALADLLLSFVVGPLDPLDDADVDALRAERLGSALGPRRWWRRRG